MAKFIITKEQSNTNILIELDDGTQAEFDDDKKRLLEAINNNEEQVIITLPQIQPKEGNSLEDLEALLLIREEQLEKETYHSYNYGFVAGEILGIMKSIAILKNT